MPCTLSRCLTMFLQSPPTPPRIPCSGQCYIAACPGDSVTRVFLATPPQRRLTRIVPVGGSALRRVARPGNEPPDTDRMEHGVGETCEKSVEGNRVTSVSRRVVENQPVEQGIT